MQRTEALIAGIRGAESGTVSAVWRGTSTPATYYTDFEGTSSAVATSVALDQYGGKVMFFDRPVTITAYSSGGSIVRTWTAGDDAGAVELKSQSFTGTPYAGGGAVAGGPTTVEAAFDKWYDSAGSTNFQVMLNGVATDLDVALSGVAGLRYFVVTDDQYGAAGDGVTNDLTAVQAAINAANSAGGGVVFFPPGTYRISGTLTTYATVAFLGYHRDLSIIRVVSTSSTLLSGPYPRSIKSLKFTFVTTPYTGTLMSFTSGASRCEISDVAIGSSVTDTPVSGTVIAAAAATVVLEISQSSLYLTETGVAVAGYNAGVEVRVYGCEGSAWGVGAASGTMFAGSALRVRNNFMSYTAGSGTKTMFMGDSLYAHSNSVVASTSSLTVFEVGSGGFIAEDATVISNSATLYGANAVGSAALYTMKLGSRRNNYLEVSGNTEPIAVPGTQAHHVLINTSNAGTWSGNAQVTIALAPVGSRLTLSVWNNTAGPLTYEWSTGVSVAGGTTFAVAADSVRTFALVSVRDASNAIPGGLQWFLVSDVAGAEVTE